MMIVKDIRLGQARPCLYAERQSIFGVEFPSGWISKLETSLTNQTELNREGTHRLHLLDRRVLVYSSSLKMEEICSSET
jgi:hypothetical protein